MLISLNPILLLWILYVNNVVIANGTSDADADVALQWTHIHVTVGDNNILHMGQGVIRKKRLTAVLGPSGSGKTTFLNAISGRLSINAYHDVIASDTQSALPRSDIAFVYQDDSFFPMLTVAETISLAYHLHSLALSNQVSNQIAPAMNETSIIASVLQSLALTHLMDNKIGDVHSTRGISGGERKRLSLACELVGSPSLLIVDEPSSGLDSFQSQNVIFLLHELARSKDIPVIITIHQPSSYIWSLLDDIMLLTPRGKVVYFGSRSEILPYFHQLGYACPHHTNPAEFLLDLVSVNTLTPESKEASYKRIDGLILTYNKMNNAMQLNTTHYSNKKDKKKAIPLKASLTLRRVTIDPLKRMAHLFTRAMRQTTRDIATNIVRVGTSILLAYVVSAVYGKQDASVTQDNLSARINIIAQGVINIGMLSMMKTLQLFKREKNIIDRERRSCKYNAFEYLLSKYLAELPFDALTAISFGLVLHSRTQLRQPLDVFLKVCGLLGLVTSSLGMAVGALFPVGDSAMAIGPALMVVYIIMGAIGPSGVGKPLPASLLPLRALSPMNHACKALVAAEFANVDLSKMRIPSAMDIVVSVRRGILNKLLRRPPIQDPMNNQILDSLGIKDASVTSSVGSLAMLFVGHVVTSLIGLVLFRPR